MVKSNRDEPATKAESVDAWIRRTPVFIYLILVALILSALITIWQGAAGLRDFYQDRFAWRAGEYEKLASLHGGISIAKFEEVLGSQTFVRTSKDGTLTESTFEGREYWVQAIYDDTGTVQLFAVTSCGRSFRPSFETPLGGVELNAVTFNIGNDNSLVAHRFFASGATRNNFFFDQYYSGNPGFYKTFFLGINDACPAVANSLTELTGKLKENPFSDLQGALSPTGIPGSLALSEFRDNSVINTYAESAARIDRGRDLTLILEEFQVGVDRTLTRTIHPEQSKAFVYPSD
jgi:hypothetical protein